jgi:hypothetical protein
MMWDKNSIKSFVLSFLKPLKNGKFTGQLGVKAGLDNIFPSGADDSFTNASPFGFISKVPKGITAFYDSLWGSGYENIILAHLDSNRPEPSGIGETILYSTDASGKVLKVKIALKNNGMLEITTLADINISCANAMITATTKATIACDDIELGVGAVEKILNGETFQTFFNEHEHLDGFGIPTSPPMTLSDPSHLSVIVKAKK